MILRRAATCIALLLSAAAAAQQGPPPGIATPTLAGGPWTFDTAEQHRIKVTVLAEGFARPFAIDFLPGGDLLIVERGIGLRVLHGATGPSPRLDSALVAGVPTADPEVFSWGVQDIALHPDFARNSLVYFTFNAIAPMPEGANPQQRQGFFKVLRGKWENGRVTQVETILEIDKASYAGGSRVHVAADGKVWVATGGPFGKESQDPASVYGKVLRLEGDGGIPPDNPLAGKQGHHPAVYSMGHRDQHGLTTHPQTGQALTVEHGPNGGDEANLIKPGANYGWPDFSFGRAYDGGAHSALPFGPGTEAPLIVWAPSIAPSGMLFYTGDRFPAWKGNLFVGSGRWGEINHTGSLQRVVLGKDMGDVRREALLSQLHHRVRDMAQGPDGLIYVLTDGPTNAVLRIEPAD
ncbi:PQQ-dependent sugar dehydrogenase [Tsuneonella sp. HG222]